MDISTKHSDARVAAARIPVLAASLALLELENPSRAHIDLYTDPVPSTPGDTPTGDLVVSISVASTAGTVDTDLFKIVLTTPIEAQITGANPSTGSVVTWAHIIDGDGDWFADVTVSDEAGSGEIKLQTTLLYNGAFCRITSAVFQG